MILLGSKSLIKKLIKPGLIILISAFLGCETANDVGVKDPFEGNLTVKYKELVLPASNIYIDSLRTDGERKILAGSYTNSLTGNVTAEGYFQYYFDGGTFPGDTLSFESMSAQFKIDSKLGSSLSENIQIFEATDTLNRSVVYLRTNNEDLSSTLVADSIILIDDENIHLNLSSIYGQKLFDLANNGASSLIPISVGGEYLSPTLAMVFQDSESLIRIDLEDEESLIKLFMTGNRKDSIYEMRFRFVSGAISTEYSNVKRSREGAEFAQIQKNTDFQISSGETIVEPISGISTAIDISSLNDFFNENENININSASFSFDFQVDESRDTIESNALYFRKDDLSFFGPASVINQFNNIVATDNSYASPILNGSLNFSSSLSYLDDSGNKLTIDATNFLRNLYGTSLDSTGLYFRNPFVENPRSLKDLVVISPENVTLGRVIFGNNGIKLRIYYTQAN